MNVDIATTSDDRQILKNMMPLYTYDLSEYYDIPVNQYGILNKEEVHTQEEAVASVDHYFDQEGWHPLIIRADHIPVGFALVAGSGSGYIDPEEDYKMAEYFVIRSYRRQGIGRSAVVSVFEQFNGRWHVFATENDRGAQAFWESVIGSHTGGVFQKIQTESGILFRFNK